MFSHYHYLSHTQICAIGVVLFFFDIVVVGVMLFEDKK